MKKIKKILDFLMKLFKINKYLDKRELKKQEEQYLLKRIIQRIRESDELFL